MGKRSIVISRKMIKKYFIFLEKDSFFPKSSIDGNLSRDREVIENHLLPRLRAIPQSSLPI